MGDYEISRRGLIAGAATTVAGASQAKIAAGGATSAPPATPAGRRAKAERIRERAAHSYEGKPLASQSTNRDEQLLKVGGKPTYIGNFSKGLVHNDFGEVEPSAYEALLTALRTGDPDKFEAVPLGGNGPLALALTKLAPFAALNPSPASRFYRLHSEAGLVATGSPQMRLVNPQAALAFDLEGPDSHELVMPAPPSFTSRAIIGEMAENYWLALCRDVPFTNYATDPLIAQAVADLNTYSEYAGPSAPGKITAATIFRGGMMGDLIGPYTSQFLLWDIPFGVYLLPQKGVFGFTPDATGERDFVIDPNSWLLRQRGVDPGVNPARIANPTLLYRGRDLANFVHIDELFQAYLNAALLLGAPPSRGGLGAPHNSGNPYDGYVPGTTPPQIRVSKQLGFGTLGEPNIKSIVAEVATRALKAVWYQKWAVHRRLRPEVFGGRIHFHRTGKRAYPFNEGEFDKLTDVLKLVEQHNASKGGSGAFLPMAFPEGSPLHPSYGAGHATVAGACATVLKAFYEPTVTFGQLGAPIFVSKTDGSSLINLKTDGPVGPYSYADLADKMTIGGEIDKIASNISIGRNFAGVHWRWDHRESLKLGEKLAVQFLRETVTTYNENARFVFNGFDGTRYDIHK